MAGVVLQLAQCLLRLRGVRRDPLGASDRRIQPVHDDRLEGQVIAPAVAFVIFTVTSVPSEVL